MKTFTFKKHLSEIQKSEKIKDLVNLDTLGENDSLKYGHIYRTLKMLGYSSEQCRTKMATDYGCSQVSLLKQSKLVNDDLECSEFSTDTPFVDIYCTNHILKYIDFDDDLVLFKNKNGSLKYLKIEELQYYYFRLNKIVFSSGGYDYNTARNYFLSDGFKRQYKIKTNRNLTPHKIALMNKILNKYNLINVYQIKKKANLYVLGSKNPCYYFEGVMEPQHIDAIEKLIKESHYHPVNLTPKDKQIKELEQTNTKQKEEIIDLKKDLEKLKNASEQNSINLDDYHCVIQKNTEFMNKISELQERLDQYGKWNIAQKPIRRFNFDEKFKRVINSDLNPNSDMSLVAEVLPTEEDDQWAKIDEIINSI